MTGELVEMRVGLRVPAATRRLHENDKPLPL